MGIYAMTGGATGIGAAIKEQVRARGDQMIVVDIRDADVVADLSKPEGRAAAIAGILERTPEGLDGFVACAGLGPNNAPALVARVNYFGAVELLEGLRDALARRRGAAVIISSNSAPMSTDADYVATLLAGDEQGAVSHLEGKDGQTAYSGSKLAVARWVRRNAAAWAAQGVRMNAVAPGYITTPLSQAAAADPRYADAMKAFVGSIPVGRAGEPEDIANVVSFLLTPAASFICGSVLFVDGGHDAMFRPDQF
jgi:NAD(P)-dependent dehydrogenase (short-subunit alcohol dehydrogenase family)